MILEYTKINKDNYIYLRQVLKEKFHLSARLILKLKKEQKILVNGEPTYLDRFLNPNDKITILIDFVEDNSNILPSEMELNILYEDEGLLILDKPAGIPVHPSMQHYSDSLSNGVKFYFDKIKLYKKIRPVNRLDRDTSGIVIFAKNEYIHNILSQQMQHGILKKKYIAICEGIFDLKEGIIDFPITRKENSIIERCVKPLGDSAITNYKVIQELNSPTSLSVLDINLITGRTHQIRVHTSYLGHPIIGDSLYGNASPFISRQALHAYKIEFLNPITNKKMVINSELPNDMKQILNYKR